MPNPPFEYKELPPFLTNFSFENEYDQLVYAYVTKDQQFDEEFIRGIQALLASAESEEPLPRYPALQEERNQLLKYWLKAEIRAIEMERLVMTLDVKMSQLADHVLEPFPGLFQQVGVSRVYKAHTVWAENQDKLRAELKGKLKVIKGGQV